VENANSSVFNGYHFKRREKAFDNLPRNLFVKATDRSLLYAKCLSMQTLQVTGQFLAVLILNLQNQKLPSNMSYWNAAFAGNPKYRCAAGQISRPPATGRVA